LPGYDLLLSLPIVPACRDAGQLSDIGAIRSPAPRSKKASRPQARARNLELRLVVNRQKVLAYDMKSGTVLMITAQTTPRSPSDAASTT